jgi:hypothetical protein
MVMAIKIIEVVADIVGLCKRHIDLQVTALGDSATLGKDC